MVRKRRLPTLISKWVRLLIIKEQYYVSALRPHKHKLVIAGNHDLGWDRTEDLDARFPKLKGYGVAEGGKLLEGVQYLLDEEIVVSR